MTKQPGGYWTNFYGLSGKNSELYDENNGHNSSDPFAQRVIRLEGIGAQSGTTYQDAMGNVLSGTIYGIAKSFGEYRNSIPYMESALLAGVEEHCLGFDYALNRINSNKAFWRGGDGTSLGCNGRTFAGDDDGAGGTEGTEDNDFGVGDINIGNGPCKVVIISYTSPVTGEIIQYEDCIDVPGYGGGVPNLPAEAQIITLFGLDPDTPIAPIVLKNKQNTREMLDGSPYPDNTPLPEGLYYALFQMENGSFVTQIFEAEHKKELSNKVPLSAKLNALVSPNPAYQKNVNLKMTSVENLAFQISGITPGGLEFVKYQVSLKENEEKHLLVLLPSNAAPGTYTLIFTFSDSSTLTKHIVKL